MKTKICLAFLLVVMLAGPVAAISPPEDGYEPGFLDPKPPAYEAPELNLDVLGVLLQQSFTDVEVGDTATGLIGGTKFDLEILEDRSMDLTVLSDVQKHKMNLPGIPEGESLDFTMVWTGASLAIDRAGGNSDAFAGVPVQPGSVDTTAIRDVTVRQVPMVESLDVSGLIADPPVETTLMSVSTDPLEQVAMIIDPDDHLQIIYDALDVDAGELLAIDAAGRLTDPAAMKTALQGISITDVSLDGVLSSLSTATKELGVVNIQGFVDGIAASGIGLKALNDAGLDPGTFVDMRDPLNPDLIAINGGVGQMAFLGSNLAGFDSSLVTSLKDPSSIKDTAFHRMSAQDALSADCVDAVPECNLILVGENKGLTKMAFAPEVGNYGTLLSRLGPVSDFGFDGAIVKHIRDCQTRDPRVDGVEAPAFVCSDTSLTGVLAKADLETMHALRRGTLKDLLPSGLPSPDARTLVSNTLGSLGMDRFNPGTITDYALYGVTTPNPSLFGTPGVPRSGLGAIDGVPAPAWPGAPAVPKIDAPVPSFYDSLAEKFSETVFPEFNPVLPTPPDANILAVVTDALGNGITAIPSEALTSLVPGAENKVTIRVVEAGGGARSYQGIEGATIQLTSSDPLGLSETTSTQQTNAFGYGLFNAAPGGFSVTATHEDYLPASGSGETLLPGQEASQEYQMKSADTDSVAGKVKANLLYIILGVAAAFIAYALWRNRG